MEERKYRKRRSDIGQIHYHKGLCRPQSMHDELMTFNV